MAQTITVIPGDGIGPEVTEATLTILRAAGAELEYEEQLANLASGRLEMERIARERLGLVRPGETIYRFD